MLKVCHTWPFFYKVYDDLTSFTANLLVIALKIDLDKVLNCEPWP
jgi:hypothetical protein